MKIEIVIFIFAVIFVQTIDARSVVGISEVDSQEIAETRTMALKMAKLVQQLKNKDDQFDDENEEDAEDSETYVKTAPIETRSNRRHFATKSQPQMKQKSSKTINKKFLFLLPFLQPIFG
uniref:Uncharacterized protein n=1 Tax=Panagrolaimus superbus TaxID=310955 RepID=A0A914ZA38_9BILA